METASSEKLKYKRLAAQFRRQVHSGALAPGDRLPTFSEMRAQFGATPTTVERVYELLERDGLVRREKRRGVFVAPPQSLPATGAIGVTGLKAGSMSHPWRMHLLEGARQAAESAGKELVLLARGSVIRWEKVDGVLNLEPASQRVVPHLPPGLPFVSALTAVEGFSSIIVDEAEGVRAAMRHLLELGHRRIAYLISFDAPDMEFLHPRVTAYQSALRGAGIEPNRNWLRHLDYQPTYRECGWRNMTRWLEEDWSTLGCTALLAQNDDTAIGAMQALREAGLQMPDDVSVAGFDGTEIGEYCTPHLTSVKVPLREVGRRAVETLLRQMEQKEGFQSTDTAPATLLLPVQLKVRASTAPPRVLTKA